MLHGLKVLMDIGLCRFMIPFLGRVVSLFDRLNRLAVGRFVRPLVAISMLLVLVVGPSSGVVQTLPSEGAVQSHVHQSEKEEVSSPLPLSLQTRVRLQQHQRVTVATMTGHKLTTAHFFSRRSPGTVSSEMQHKLNRG